ncbi:MAG: aldose 1-epimerase family protein [Alphaproteobacteria bacterium]|nr:aldose 1-epimerase family protein [Alphaproteobacteria bacterium]
MRHLLAAAAICALSVPAPLPALAAAGEHSKLLIDTATNLATANWKVSSADWAKDGPAWSVQLRTLHGGRQEGVQVIEVDNGAMSLTVVPTRGFELWKAKVGDLRLGWDSPVKEIIHPSYIRLNDNEGRGWVAGFGGLMVRGGLASFGNPVIDGDQQLTLHGHVDYIPASQVSVRYESGKLILRGVVNDFATFGAQLQLVSEISTVIGKPELVFDDTVTNLSDAPQDMQLLYHTNFGTPLLGAGAEFVAPVKKVQPINTASAAGGLVGWNRYSGPHAAPYAAQVFNMSLHADSTGMTKAMLKSPDGGRAVLMSFDTKGLPYMSLWKNETTAKSGYVTGLEPGTGFPNTRPEERAAGRVPNLKGGEVWRTHLAIAGLTSKSEVDSAAAAIQKLAVAPPIIDKTTTGP